jgi:hypothetical protein
MKTRGVSFRHAVELLREGLPSSAAGSPTETPAPIKHGRRCQALPFASSTRRTASAALTMPMP